MQPIDCLTEKIQTLFVENGVWQQNFIDFVKVEEVIKEFKIGVEWRQSPVLSSVSVGTLIR